jgi:endonuclease YncB( thermonuclease family)
MPHLLFAALANPRRGNAWLLACVLLALGTIAVELIDPNLLPQHLLPQYLFPNAAHRSAYRPYGDRDRDAIVDPRIYSATVVRIIDGDTFVARVREAPGRDYETRVRLRRIDAAELHARCGHELRLALAARAALQRLLADGRVTLSRIGPDKYPGRIDANVATRGTADVSDAMLNGGFARAYDGGRRGSWCG